MTYSDTGEEMLENLTKLLELCVLHNFTLSPKKCQWAAEPIAIIYAGILISSKCCSQDPNTLKALTDFPTPVDRKAVQALIGALSQYLIWFPEISAITTNICTLINEHSNFVCT